MPKTFARLLAVLLALALVAAACSGDDDDGGAGNGTDAGNETGDDTGDDDGENGDDIDYAALGLWDDGPCDSALDPLVIGLMTAFEAPTIALGDQALALEAAAEAFNARGGANGACIEVHTCDDNANFDQALACVREIDNAGVVATVNDQGTTAQAEVSAAMAEAGIPRVASNVTQNDWSDQNAYPTDASGTGVVFLMPQGLIDQGITEIGMVRVDLAAASALIGLLSDVYEDEGATFPLDIAVPAGTTDYSQFTLAAEDAGVGGITLAIAEEQAIQVVRAAQQLGTDLRIGASLGTFSHANAAEFGDFAGQMIFLWPFPPATFDVPVYSVLRDDLAASGREQLQPENLKSSPMRSWIGLYALLQMIRDAGLTEFTRDAITTMLNEAEDVPMLDIFGGEDWTPAFNHAGIWQRAGTNHWGVYEWDPDAQWDGNDGNFVEVGEISFDDVLCGSPFGAQGPC